MTRACVNKARRIIASSMHNMFFPGNWDQPGSWNPPSWTSVLVYIVQAQEGHLIQILWFMRFTTTLAQSHGCHFSGSTSNENLTRCTFPLLALPPSSVGKDTSLWPDRQPCMHPKVKFLHETLRTQLPLPPYSTVVCSWPFAVGMGLQWKWL